VLVNPSNCQQINISSTKRVTWTCALDTNLLQFNLTVNVTVAGSYSLTAKLEVRLIRLDLSVRQHLADFPPLIALLWVAPQSSIPLQTEGNFPLQVSPSDIDVSKSVLRCYNRTLTAGHTGVCDVVFADAFQNKRDLPVDFLTANNITTENVGVFLQSCSAVLSSVYSPALTVSRCLFIPTLVSYSLCYWADTFRC